MKRDARKNILYLPRGYISWSQLDLWEKDQKTYIKRYFLGEEDKGNAYMAYGSKVAKDAENGESDDLVIAALNTILPTYPKAEYEITHTIETKRGPLKLLGKLDQFRAKPLAFRERKTGMKPWTQSRVDKHGQIDFYYILIGGKHDAKPSEIDAWLDWAGTEWRYNEATEEQELTLTGETRSYPAPRTAGDILKMKHRIITAAIEIDAAYREQLLVL